MPTVDILDWSDEFLPILYEHLKDAPIKNAIKGCSGTCRVTVLAPALAVDRCLSFLQYRNFSKPISDKEAKLLDAGIQLTPESRHIFQIGFQALNGSVERE